MGQVILVLMAIIGIALLSDFHYLKKEASMGVRFAYVAMFGSGVVILFLYGCQIAIPNIPIGQFG